MEGHQVDAGCRHHRIRGRDVDPRREARNAPATGLRGEVFAPEFEQHAAMRVELCRVDMFTRLLVERLDGEIREMSRKATGRRVVLQLAQTTNERADGRSSDEPLAVGQGAERNTAPCARAFKQRQLGVGSEQDSHLGPRHAVGDGAPARLGNTRRLDDVALVFHDRRSPARGARRPWRIPHHLGARTEGPIAAVAQWSLLCTSVMLRPPGK